MILITESKRDDLLIPYYNLVKDKCEGLTLGEFKKWMLKKLAAQGGINNVSLSSNYYLAGATRYYFQGALTTNGQATMLSGDPDKPDQWNADVCRRLNALIEILRNAYIDTVGTTFEQPEDFGTMPLNKLLRKYAKKIDAVLGSDAPEEKKPEDTLDRSNRVGNGYTFDILYNYEQATKYNRFTVPGAWCITYGSNHYNSYIRNLGIHYVIFRKDGFENVERPEMPVDKRKPQDEYGNSLIAFLQSNSGPTGVYITSRWNHGYGQSSGTEADHAYTNEEFMRITGVTPEDLKRIYTIWKTDYKNYSDEDVVDKSEERKTQKLQYANVLRKFKYAQMIINGGESVKRAFELAGFEFMSAHIVNGNGQLGTDEASFKKSVVEYHLSTEGVPETKILVDRTKLLFETIPVPGRDDMMDFTLAQQTFGCEESAFPGLILIGYDGNYRLYNARYHQFLDIGGVTKFKKVPVSSIRRSAGSVGVLYAEIKNGMKDVALISAASCRPVKLPNGQYWANEIFYDDESRWERGGQIHCHIITSNGVGPVAEFLYDESSREKYFFNLYTGKFLDWTKKLYDMGDGEPTISTDALVRSKNIFGVTFIPRGDQYRWRSNHDGILLFTVDGKPFSIYGQNKFLKINTVANGRFFIYKDDRDESTRRYIDYYAVYVEKNRIFDTQTQKCIAIGDKPVLVSDAFTTGRFSSRYDDDDEQVETKVLYLTPSSKEDLNYMYDMEKGLLFRNDIQRGFSNEALFKCKNPGRQSAFVYYIDDYSSWKTYTELAKLSRDALMRTYGTDDVWAAEKIEEKKHIKSVPFEQMNHIPNNLPINGGENSPVAEPASSMALSESDIRSITKQVIRETLKKIKLS